MHYLDIRSSRRHAYIALTLSLLEIMGLTPNCFANQETGRYTVRPQTQENTINGRAQKSIVIIKVFSISRPQGSSDQGTQKAYLKKILLPIYVDGANETDTMLLVGIDGHMKATDDLGNIIDHPIEAFLSFRRQRISSIWSRQGEISLTILNPTANSLKILEGNLLIANGMIHTFTFPIAQLQAGAQQARDRAEVRIEKILVDKEWVEVYLSYVLPSDPLTRLSASEVGEKLSLPDIQVELVDATGNVYRPSATNSTAVAKPRDNSRQSLVSHRDTFYVGFTLPAKAIPETLNIHLLERHGPNRRVPFRLSDIPLINQQ